MDRLKKREERRGQLLKKYVVNELIKKQNRAQFIKVLEEESKFWLSNEDYLKSDIKTLIPHASQRQNDYYSKLQEVG